MVLNENTMQRIINRLKRSDTIDIYGMGISNDIARAAAFKLKSIGVESYAYDGINEHYMMTNVKKHNKSAIIISLTGANSAMVRIAGYLRKNGVFVVGIGGSWGEELKKNCSEYVEVYTRKKILSLEVITSFTAVNYILDIFLPSC